MKLRRAQIVVLVVVLLLGGMPLLATWAETAAAATAETTEFVSRSWTGLASNDHSQEPSISGYGRYVAFSSYASDLVAGDTNGQRDVFVRDRIKGTTTRVSVASDGTQGNGGSYVPGISADGRYVAFRSAASNLVAGDTNARDDTFVHDRQTGATTRVSVASDGTQGNGGSYLGRISSNGRYVAFESSASNLVAGDTNGTSDVFVHDRQTGTTTRVSVASDGTQGSGRSYGPGISADGRYIGFVSAASNLVAGDTNGRDDTFVHDLQTGATTRVSVASDGTQGNGLSYGPDISADGRYIAFTSYASNLVAGDTNAVTDTFVHDRQTGATTRVSVAADGTQGNGQSFSTDVSTDARYIAFQSQASNLVAGDTNAVTDTFVHDRQTGTTTRVSVASDGTQGNDASRGLSISADGLYVAFGSFAENLVAGDTNGASDVFERGPFSALEPIQAARPNPVCVPFGGSIPTNAVIYTRSGGIHCYDPDPVPPSCHEDYRYDSGYAIMTIGFSTPTTLVASFQETAAGLAARGGDPTAYYQYAHDAWKNGELVSYGSAVKQAFYIYHTSLEYQIPRVGDLYQVDFYVGGGFPAPHEGHVLCVVYEGRDE